MGRIAAIPEQDEPSGSSFGPEDASYASNAQGMTPATAAKEPSSSALPDRLSNKSAKNVPMSSKHRPSPLRFASKGASAQNTQPPSSTPVFQRSATERLAGSANRLLDNSSRLFVGYGKRPSAPAPSKKDSAANNNKEAPQTSPRIFEVGEVEKVAFKATSALPSTPHHAAAWSKARKQVPEKQGSERRSSDEHPTPIEASQTSPTSTLPSNPSPDSMLQLLHGRPPSSVTSTASHRRYPTPESAFSTKSAGGKKRSPLSHFFRSYDPADSVSVTGVDERHPQTALKVLRKPSDASLPTEPASEPPQDRRAQATAREDTVENASAVQLRSTQSSPAPPKGAQSGTTPFVRFQPPPLDGAAPPASPREVLERPEAPSATEGFGTKMRPDPLARVTTDTSGGIVHVSSETESSPYFVQDRVLVSWGRSRNEHLPADLNEKHARRFDIEMESWRECMLVAKGQVLEIYTSHHVANRVRSSHKLLDRIPLEASTTLSLFSPADYTFMMTCPEHSRRRAVANRLKAGFKPARRLEQVLKKEKNEKNQKGAVRGSAIFAIRAQCPSIAQDFYWHIWRALGRSPPTKLEVALPSLGARFTFKVPQTLQEAQQLNPEFKEPVTSMDPMYWSALTSECLVAAVRRAVESVPEWMELSAYASAKGLNPVLAWRRDNYLDWVRHESTVTGQSRPWALVAGFAMSEHAFSLQDGLEIRLAAPYPKSVPVADHIKEEPASIEGPCVRLHGVGYRDHIYLFSLGPHLFVVSEQTAAKPALPDEDPEAQKVRVRRSEGFFNHIGKAFALNRPVQEVRQSDLAETSSSSESSTNDFERGRRFEMEEKDRYLRLVRSARGFLHLCDVESVKVGNGSDSVQELQEDTRVLGELLEQDGQAEADESQVSVLEVNMSRGRQLKIEVMGKKGALQWVYRLRLLSEYWRARTAADAKQQLSFSPNSAPFCRQAAQNQCGKDIVKDPSPTGEDAYLNLAYNWSIVTGARGYTLSGVLFTKNEGRTQYTRRLCVLIRGFLFFYKVVPLAFSNRTAQQTWHPSKGFWDLKDSYVISQGALCSGWNVASDDPGYKPGEHFGPRIYEDGLRAADEDEDCCLAIWKRIGNSDLTKKAKVVVLRARSKSERDQWAFALNCEIERLVRLDRQGDASQQEP